MRDFYNKEITMHFHENLYRIFIDNQNYKFKKEKK